MPETLPSGSINRGAATGRFIVNVVLLVVVACVAGVLWRAELEWHGWGGLDWARYFHWAIPAGAMLFIAWVVWVNRHLPVWHRLFVAVCLLLTTAVVYGLTEESVFVRYYRSRWFGNRMDETRYARAQVMWYLTPTIFAVVARLLRLGAGFWRVVLAHWLFIASYPVCVGLLVVTDHPGGPDFIHTIKSGFIIPFLMVAIGILFLPGVHCAWKRRS